MWWGVLSELAETRKNLSAYNAKSKGGRLTPPHCPMAVNKATLSFLLYHPCFLHTFKYYKKKKGMKKKERKKIIQSTLNHKLHN